MTAPEAWRRTFAGSIPEVVDATRWIESIASEQTLPKDTVFALQVCAEELLVNIVRHGGNAAPNIDLQLRRFPKRIELVVEDDGKPFDVASSSHHGIDRPLAEVTPGGLGVHLIHTFADRLTYERKGAINRVVAEFRLAADE